LDYVPGALREPSVATQRGLAFREHERKARTAAELWKQWTFPISEADKERVRAAEAAARAARLEQARLAHAWHYVGFAPCGKSGPGLDSSAAA
jgi:hypothetical protein